MTEAYEIGVTLALNDGVSDGIAKARRDVAQLEGVLRAGGVSIEQLRVASGMALSAIRSVPAVRMVAGKEAGAVRRDVMDAPAPVARGEAVRAVLPVTAAVPRNAVAADLRPPVVAAPVGQAPVMPAGAAPTGAGDAGHSGAAPQADGLSRALDGAQGVLQVSAPILVTQSAPAAREAGTAAVMAPVADRVAGRAALAAEPSRAAAPVVRGMDEAVGGMVPPVAPRFWEPPASGSRLQQAQMPDEQAGWQASGVAAGLAGPFDGGERDGSGEGGGGGAVAGSQVPAAPPAAAPASAPAEGDVYLDGALVGRWMSRFLTQEAGRASAGPTGFDARRGRLLPGATVGG